MIEAGCPEPLGAHADGKGVNFAVWAPRAERIELCLFDGVRERRVDLQECSGGTWHGYLPGCEAGQRYGYRAHGRYAPREGLRFNPAKLLMDPYARALDGGFEWSPAVFDFVPGEPDVPNRLDSAPHVPRCVVAPPARAPRSARPRIPWSETIVLEAGVRGFTMRHPGLSEAERGRFSGMCNAKVLEYLKALGITTVELLPVFAWIDEEALARRGLANFWGYNTINFFTPDARLGGEDPSGEFRDMVEAIHGAGMEVVLDVVYNHTAESDAAGPTLSFRGLDNPGYYRLDPHDASRYVNWTGCGNTLDADRACVQSLVVDSLAWWRNEMGVDGFRFDLATVLGRGRDGFDAGHPLLQRISKSPALNGVKLIAEPWDVGPDGYGLGRFPAPWAEWNDRYRNAVRRFWLRGGSGSLGALAGAVHGSSDLFEPSGREPWCSINFAACHDGFTLADLVSYERRHNRANGEGNRDGERHDFSANHGIEGPTDDSEIVALRRRQRLNLLATVLFSQGTPMLLAGDEIGNSQSGNNNAYAQDNELGWVDWDGLDSDPGFLDEVRRLAALRGRYPALRMPGWVHEPAGAGDTGPGVTWLHAEGRAMRAEDWVGETALGVMLVPPRETAKEASMLLLFNAGPAPRRFALPEPARGQAWVCRFASDGNGVGSPAGRGFNLQGHAMACLSGDGAVST